MISLGWNNPVIPVCKDSQQNPGYKVIIKGKNGVFIMSSVYVLAYIWYTTRSQWQGSVHNHVNIL